MYKDMKGNDNMPVFKKSKYSVVQTQEISMRVLGVLIDAKTALTIDEICQQDIHLVGQTTQKIARVLNSLIEGGLVVKTKSKSKQKMIYAAITSLEEQGYDINNIVC